MLARRAAGKLIPKRILLPWKQKAMTLLKEVLGLSDGEDRGIVDSLQQSCRALFVVTDNKKKIAGPGIVVLEKMTDLQRMRGDSFSLQRAFQKSRQRVFIGNAKDQHAIRRSQHLGRPINELSEMENERGFQLILSGRGLCVHRNWS
jgi:hypothetical protein